MIPFCHHKCCSLMPLLYAPLPPLHADQRVAARFPEHILRVADAVLAHEVEIDVGQHERQHAGEGAAVAQQQRCARRRGGYELLDEGHEAPTDILKTLAAASAHVPATLDEPVLSYLVVVPPAL